MNIEEQLEYVDEATTRAFEHITNGELKKALSVASQLKGLTVTNEASRAEAIIKGYVLHAKRKNRRAKELCLKSVAYLWGNYDGLYLIRQSHPEPNRDTRFFNITIKGGCAAFGLFTVFTSEHVSDFEVVANSEEEAIRYVEEVAPYQESDAKIVLDCRVRDLGEEDEVDRCGVYGASPFRLES